MNTNPRVLVYGYGNPGRGDDGLGPAFINQLEAWKRKEDIDHIDTDSNYQLNIEEAFTIRDYDRVVFVDASAEEIANYQLVRVQPSDKVSFTMHAMHPAFVLDLCKKLYGKSPEVFLLKIRGYDFTLSEGLSDRAAANLLKAFSYLKKIHFDPEGY